jgi:hypothetical protein
MRRPPKTRARLLQLLLPLDEDGNFLGAFALVLEGCTEVEAIEEVAFREGLALVGDLVFIPLGWQASGPMRR